MARNDMTPQNIKTDVLAGIGLLTRLPVKVDMEAAAARGAASAWAWPVVGLVVGGIAAVVGTLAHWLGLTPPLAAGLVLATQVIVTGALHEDGLADTADGLWGGADKERRLEIMKDSRIGSYGVIALVLSLVLRWAALALLLDAGSLWAPVLAAGLISRLPMVALMHLMPNARGEGLSHTVGRPGKDALALAIGVTAIVAFVFTGLTIVPLVLVGAAVSAALYYVATDKIGGQTGDILGASQQLVEIAALAVLASVV